jgi:hypothetical protein
MFHTVRADIAYEILRSYTQTPEQHEAVKQAYVDTLAGNDSEDKVIIAMLGYVLDGLRYGNWLWNMPPSAGNVILDSPTAQMTVTCPAHGHPHEYPESRNTGSGDMSKKQW